MEQQQPASQNTSSTRLLAYLEELAIDVAHSGGLNGRTVEQALAQAHARRQACAKALPYRAFNADRPHTNDGGAR